MLYYYFGSKETCSSPCWSARTSTSAPRSRRCTSKVCRPPRACAGWWSSRGSYFLPTPSSSRCSTPRTSTAREHLKRSRKIRAMHSPLVAMLSGRARPRRARARVPEGRRSVAAVRIDRRARLLLSVQQRDAVDRSSGATSRAPCARPSGSNTRWRSCRATWSGDDGRLQPRRRRHILINQPVITNRRHLDGGTAMHQGRNSMHSGKRSLFKAAAIALALLADRHAGRRAAVEARRSRSRSSCRGPRAARPTRSRASPPPRSRRRSGRRSSSSTSRARRARSARRTRSKRRRTATRGPPAPHRTSARTRCSACSTPRSATGRCSSTSPTSPRSR